MTTPAIDMAKLVTGVLNILGAGTPLPYHFDRLADECGLPEGPITIAFFTGLRHLLADLPEQAFADRQVRLATLEAVQGALDSEIEREEERLEGAPQEQS